MEPMTPEEIRQFAASRIKNDYAFPCPGTPYNDLQSPPNDGMSYRQYVAAQAVAGLAHYYRENQLSPQMCAQCAVAIADALCEELAK